MLDSINTKQLIKIASKQTSQNSHKNMHGEIITKPKITTTGNSQNKCTNRITQGER